MSVLEASNDVQVWNNAAFDSGGGVDRSVELKNSWMDFDQKLINESVEYDSSKENQNPLMNNSPALFKTPGAGKIGLMSTGKKDSVLRDDSAIDLEIEQIEMEMSRLALKLEALKQEKAERKQRLRDRRVSIVPAKYMNPKQSINLKSVSHQKTQNPTPQRRGMSLCPAEIYSATKSRQLTTKQPISTISSSVTKQSRRQSCFWKLGEIDELKVTKQRGGKSASVSPKCRKPVPKFESSKKAVTSIGAKKPVDKNVGVLSSVQPKKLFKDGGVSERSVTLKKPIKPGRVVPSRYNQTSTTEVKLRSSSETEQPEVKRGGGCVAGTGSRVKKRWEIPSKGEVVVYQSDGESTPVVDENDVVDVVMPRKIKTVRCVNETPRDSGAVKRVADLAGKKSFFSVGGGGGGADGDNVVGVCQALSFADEATEDA